MPPGRPEGRQGRPRNVGSGTPPHLGRRQSSDIGTRSDPRNVRGPLSLLVGLPGLEPVTFGPPDRARRFQWRLADQHSDRNPLRHKGTPVRVVRVETAPSGLSELRCSDDGGRREHIVTVIVALAPEASAV